MYKRILFLMQQLLFIIFIADFRLVFGSALSSFFARDAKLEIEKDLEEGILLTLLQLVRDGLLDLSVGIERSGISEAEFIEKLKQLA